jgi:hypothetical protein
MGYGSPMSMILTVLEAHVAPEQVAALQTAYREALGEAFPPGFVRSLLVRHAMDPTLWRIETTWESR